MFAAASNCATASAGRFVARYSRPNSSRAPASFGKSVRMRIASSGRFVLRERHRQLQQKGLQLGVERRGLTIMRQAHRPTYLAARDSGRGPSSAAASFGSIASASR